MFSATYNFALAPVNVIFALDAKALADSRYNLPLPVTFTVVESIEETLAEVHITNRVDPLREMDATWHLTIAMSPMVFNALHVPLVDDDDNFLFRALIDGLEEVVVALVDDDALDGREEDVEGLDEPVDHVRVDASLGELGRLRVVEA